jgi:hypothetical protein
LLKKYTKDQSQKGKYYAFKDFILDLIQKITDPALREHEDYSGNDKSLATMSTAATPWKDE